MIKTCISTQVVFSYPLEVKMEPAQQKQPLLRTSHHEHSHAFSFSKAPWFGEGSGAPRCIPHPRQAWPKGEVVMPHPQGLAFAGSSLCQAEAAVKRDIRKARFELFQHKMLSLLPALVPLFPWTTAAPALLELCGALSWAAPACSGQNQNQLITRESCQHRRQSANSQAIFLMIFLMPWKEEEGFKTTSEAQFI